MIGDSIVEGGEWSEIFRGIRVANRGIGSDTSEDILLRMDAIFSVNAKKAFIAVGINDVFGGKDLDAILNNYAEIVRRLKNRGLDVYVQSTIECSRRKCGINLEKIRALNRNLKAYALAQGINYININSGLATKENGLLDEYSPDGVHLFGAGYLQWSKAIEPYVYAR